LFLSGNNTLIFLMERKCVFCALGTKFQNIKWTLCVMKLMALCQRYWHDSPRISAVIATFSIGAWRLVWSVLVLLSRQFFFKVESIGNKRNIFVQWFRYLGPWNIQVYRVIRLRCHKKKQNVAVETGCVITLRQCQQSLYVVRKHVEVPSDSPLTRSLWNFSAEKWRSYFRGLWIMACRMSSSMFLSRTVPPVWGIVWHFPGTCYTIS
jgi:hypothetical protein